jgi:hypothetical protein
VRSVLALVGLIVLVLVAGQISLALGPLVGVALAMAVLATTLVVMRLRR